MPHGVKGGHRNTHCGLSSQATASYWLPQKTHTQTEQQSQKESVYTLGYRSITPDSQRPLWASVCGSDGVASPCRPTMYPLPHCSAAISPQTKHDCVHLQHVEAAVPKQNSNSVNSRWASCQPPHPQTSLTQITQKIIAASSEPPPRLIYLTAKAPFTITIGGNVA